MSSAPAARAVGPVALWAVVGTVTAAWLSGPVATWGAAVAWSLAGGGTVVVAAAVAVHGRARTRIVLTTVAVAAVATGVGAVRVALVDAGPLADLAANGGARQVEAVVAEEPRTSRSGWWTVVRVERVGDVRTRERALLRGDDQERPAVGSRWVGTATAAPLDEDGFGSYLRQRYAAVRITPASWEQRAPPTGAFALSETVRRRVRGAAERALPVAHAGLASGLVTGDTSLLPHAVEEAMRDTGLTHLVAVSGSNVALVVAGLLVVAAAVRAGPRVRRVVLAAGLVWFAVLTRWEPSVLRASAMAGVVLLAGVRGVVGDPRHALAVAVLTLVLLDPGIAGSLGMLLSAGATAGVLVVAPRVRRRLGWLPGRVGDLLAVTIGAQLAVAPLLLWTVGEVPLASIPANMLAVPAAAAASAVAIVGAAVAAVHPGAAVPVFAATRPAVAVVLWAAEHLRTWSTVVSIQRPATLLAAVVGVTWLLASRRRRVLDAVALVTLALAAPVGLPGRGVDGLIVTAIDVGQGDAILVEAPGATVLVDGGGDGRAATWLRRAGIRRFDAVVVSHPHADHVAGLPDILRRSAVGALWTPDVPADLPENAELRALAAARGVPHVHPVAGQRATVGGLAVEVLGPPPGRRYRASDSELNDTSIVLRVAHGGRTALLTGDVEEPAQRDLLTLGDRLRAGLLKVPHHGAGTTDPAFLRATGARIALVSVGTGNRYGHPAPRTIETLQAMEARVRRTDREGTIRAVVPATDPEFAPAATGAPDLAADPAPRSRLVRRIASRHVRPQPRLPARRRRRPPPAPRARAPPRRAPRGHARAGRRARRRLGGLRVAGDAHRVAVRGRPRRRPAWRRVAVRLAGRRGRRLAGRPRPCRGARPAGQRHRTDQVDRQPGREGRGAARREVAGAVGRPGVGAARP